MVRMLIRAPLYYLVAPLTKMAMYGTHVAGEEYPIKAEEARLGNEAILYLNKNKESEHIDMKALKDMAGEELMLGAKDVGMGVGLRNRVMSNLRGKVTTEHVEMHEFNRNEAMSHLRKKCI